MIVVKYSCPACGLRDREVICPEREPGQDVVDYVARTIAECIGADHLDKSPRCTARTMKELKIPFRDGYPLGTK